MRSFLVISLVFSVRLVFAFSFYFLIPCFTRRRRKSRGKAVFLAPCSLFHFSVEYKSEIQKSLLHSVFCLCCRLYDVLINTADVGNLAIEEAVSRK